MNANWLRSDRAAVAVAALALAAGGAWRASLPVAADAAPYHARVRAAAAAVPLSAGDWVGTDVPVPPEAVDELRPNVDISRRYVNRATGRQLSLLVVQCPDVRDLFPHSPPVCYPGQGMTLNDQTPVDLAVAGAGAVTATRYGFRWNDFRRGTRTVVDHFMILPDGTTQADTAGLERRIGARQRYLGAAEVQVVYDGAVPPAEQTADTEQVLRAYGPLLKAIRSGAERDGH